MQSKILSHLAVFLKAKKTYQIVIAAVTILFASYEFYTLHKRLKVEETKARQANGYLDNKERELQTQKEKFNISNSQLVKSNSELEKQAKKYRKKYVTLTKEYEKYIKDNELVLKSYTNNIYSLKQQIKFTKEKPAIVKTIIKEGKCTKDAVAEYSFADPDGRISLYTPNCLATGNESFSLNQSFILYGEYYQQRDGLLQISSLTLSEVLNEDHSVVLTTANLVGSDFRYISSDFNPPKKPEKITLGILMDHKLKLALSFGYNAFTYNALSLNISANMNDSIDVYPALKLIYRPSFLSKEFNLGFSSGVGYSFEESFLYLLGVDFFLW